MLQLSWKTLKARLRLRHIILTLVTIISLVGMYAPYDFSEKKSVVLTPGEIDMMGQYRADMEMIHKTTTKRLEIPIQLNNQYLGQLKDEAMTIATLADRSHVIAQQINGDKLLVKSFPTIIQDTNTVTHLVIAFYAQQIVNFHGGTSQGDSTSPRFAQQIGDIVSHTSQEIAHLVE